MSHILCDRGYPDYPPRLEKTNLSRTLGYSTTTKVTKVAKSNKKGRSPLLSQAELGAATFTSLI